MRQLAHSSRNFTADLSIFHTKSANQSIAGKVFGYRKMHWGWIYFWKTQYLMKKITFHCHPNALKIPELQKCFPDFIQTKTETAENRDYAPIEKIK
jgi:hypothetical protein